MSGHFGMLRMRDSNFCFFPLLAVRNDVKGQFVEEFQVVVVRNQTGQKEA